jgi:hypothetical protein
VGSIPHTKGQCVVAGPPDQPEVVEVADAQGGRHDRGTCGTSNKRLISLNLLVAPRLHPLQVGASAWHS